jgi:hypothetical protein
MQYCVNGIVGSLGTLARMSAPPAAHSYSYRSSLNGPRAMGRVAVPPPRPASAFFGQGCDPGAVPAADELPIIKQIESLQAARTAARAVCDRRYAEKMAEYGPNPTYTQQASASVTRLQCRGAAYRTFTQQIQGKQDQLAALCAAKSAGLVSSEPSISIMEEEDLPMQTQPVDDEPPVTEELPAGNGKLSTAMMLAIGAGVLMVAGTGIYWLTRRR